METEDIFEDFPHSPTCYTSKGVKFHRTEFCARVKKSVDDPDYYWHCTNCDAEFWPNGARHG